MSDQILIDSSAWIAFFNDRPVALADRVEIALTTKNILVGDLIMAEVLQGFRRDRDFEAARRALRSFRVVTLCNPRLAVQCAHNYRTLRGLGITVRKTIDTVIATYCIENDVMLLHDDRDFDGFEQYLGLRVWQPV